MNYQSEMAFNVCSYLIREDFWEEIPDVWFNQYCLDAPDYIPAGSTKSGPFGGDLPSDVRR